MLVINFILLKIIDLEISIEYRHGSSLGDAHTRLAGSAHACFMLFVVGNLDRLYITTELDPINQHQEPYYSSLLILKKTTQ